MSEEVTVGIQKSKLESWQETLACIADPQVSWNKDTLSMAQEAIEDMKALAADVYEDITESLGLD